MKFNIENLPAGILPVFFSQKSFGRQKIKHTKIEQNTSQEMKKGASADEKYGKFEKAKRKKIR